MKPRRLSEAYGFLPAKFLPRLIYGSALVRAFLLCLEPGQGIAPRADSEEMLCYVVEGRAKLMIGEETFGVSAGDFAAAAPGEVRGIEAEERAVVLWVHVSREQSKDA